MPRSTPHIALLIVGRPLCIPCIADHTNATEDTVALSLAAMRESLTVFREDDAACEACGTMATVFSLTRPRTEPLVLRAHIRAKLANRELPHEARVQVWSVPRRPERCAACDQRVESTEAVAECVSGGRRYSLHVECMYVWYLERNPGAAA